MPKKIIPAPKTQKGVSPNRGILELDRFTQENLSTWQSASEDLDQLQGLLFFALEPARRQLRADLIAALQMQPAKTQLINDWVRVVTYQYSDEPLSCAGSLHEYGGRFNAGADLDANTLNPWPVLYLAQDFATAFREKFQLEHDGVVDGLSANELSLGQVASHATLYLKGEIKNVFDMTSPSSLNSIAKLLGKIKMPEEAKACMKRLKISNKALFMINTGQQLYDTIVKTNWRVLPIQFGLPAQSHIIAELVRAAGFEGILYASTKGQKRCLAVFPENLATGSFVELRDKATRHTKLHRLDIHTSAELTGWHTLPANFKNVG